MCANKTKPKVVLFDMDGLLVDSMPYHFIAWYEALRPYGVRVSCFDIYSREGERWEKSLKEILRKAKVNPSAQLMRKIFLRRERIFKKNFKRFLFPGVEDTLKFLRLKGFHLGLVTGTPMAGIKEILAKHILSYFDCIVSGDEVRHGKPHPEPYLKGALLSGCEPSQCVVVENAPLGIESGKAACMYVIAIETSLPANYLQEADIVFNDISKIKAFLAKMR